MFLFNHEPIGIGLDDLFKVDVLVHLEQSRGQDINLHKGFRHLKRHRHREEVAVVVGLGLELEASARIVRVDGADGPLQAVARDLVHGVETAHGGFGRGVRDRDADITQGHVRVGQLVLDRDGVGVVRLVDPRGERQREDVRRVRGSGRAPAQYADAVVRRESLGRVFELDRPRGVEEVLVHVGVRAELGPQRPLVRRNPQGEFGQRRVGNLELQVALHLERPQGAFAGEFGGECLGYGDDDGVGVRGGRCVVMGRGRGGGAGAVWEVFDQRGLGLRAEFLLDFGKGVGGLGLLAQLHALGRARGGEFGRDLVLLGFVGVVRVGLGGGRVGGLLRHLGRNTASVRSRAGCFFPLELELFGFSFTLFGGL